jgi:pyridoxamine 5'-phosphate oxidase
MDIKDCIKFANETIVSYVATVEGDQPGVRALGF